MTLKEGSPPKITLEWHYRRSLIRLFAGYSTPRERNWALISPALRLANLSQNNELIDCSWQWQWQ
ncbi:uncharacterized protein BO95DRAFT_438080 [Aspergillus brunneoviolaceus CBS 621.78]|uniref:Uncharacterized protein n=1 Tax=Aspergillus brunneoviolaceus CBS 621.78 TaxID=1450534 RepID=A0ACD1GN98_9EURO|nr:hypothetical protein BO95DRAFT_438080 [Aspergillus brunneoviolaceus CBS 621.78]RAH50820.1 hypothetical protein BO95DRAFT_438080 [Aspergillus brunneoviolaceus CBS 621.78]